MNQIVIRYDELEKRQGYLKLCGWEEDNLILTRTAGLPPYTQGIPKKIDLTKNDDWFALLFTESPTDHLHRHAWSVEALTFDQYQDYVRRTVAIARCTGSY